jgi:hypothetical protein
MTIKPFWLVIFGLMLFGSGAVLFKGCGKVKTVTYCPPINIDSLKATISPDTFLMPGEQVVKWFPRVVDLTDTAAVDSLLTSLTEQKEYYSGLVDRLEGAIQERDSAITEATAQVEHLELLLKTNVYEDSVTTATYFHRWRIAAEGPIQSYSFAVLPIFPQPETPPRILHNRIAILAGGQAEAGAIRQLYEVEYSRRWLGVKAGYLPRSNALNAKPALQLTAGLNVRF